MYEVGSTPFVSQFHGPNDLQTLVAVAPISRSLGSDTEVVGVPADTAFGIATSIRDHSLNGFPRAEREFSGQNEHLLVKDDVGVALECTLDYAYVPECSDSGIGGTVADQMGNPRANVVGFFCSDPSVGD